MNHVVETIQRSPLFAGMSGLELNAVSAFLEPRRFRKGDVIFRRGDRGKELFIVRSGLVASTVTDSDGRERELYRFGPSGFFGEMSVIEDEPRSATCVALEDTELLALEGLDFYRLVWEYPMLGSHMLAAMARVMAGWLDEASGFLTDMVRWGETARRRAVTDELSGLFNRRFIEEAAHARFARSASGSCSILMLDLDRFHLINDSYGKEAGDAVLSTAGAAYSRLVRDGDVAARLSGDEFAFLMPDAGIDEALALAERVRAETESLYLEFRAGPGASPKRVRLSASIGAAASPEHADGPEALFAAADKALFAAKRGGRNRVVRFR